MLNEKCEDFLTQFEPIIQEYHALLTTNAIFIKRTAGIGVMSAEMICACRRWP